MRIGTRLPLLFRCALPALDLVKQALRLVRRDHGSDGVGNVFGQHRQCQLFTFEIQLRIGRCSLAIETPLADRLDLADPVLRVVDVGALLDVNGRSPVECQKIQYLTIN